MTTSGRVEHCETSRSWDVTNNYIPNFLCAI